VHGEHHGAEGARPHEHRDGHGDEHAERRPDRPRVERATLALALSGLGTALGILGEFIGWPEPVTIGLFIVAILAGAVEIVPRGIRGVFRERSLDINFLVTVAVIGAMLLGQWGEGATVVFLFSLGEFLEELTLARTRRSIQALMAIAPETAQLRRPDGSEVTARVEDVPVGATVIVRPGDRVPLDGTVTAGESAIDQAPITGESVPVDKATGDTVYAGTINGAGYLEVRTTKPFAENTLAKIIHLVESAQSEKAPAQRFVERFARVYTPLVVVGAVVLAAVPPLVFGEPLVPWFNRALVLLLVACPCALVISTPVSVVAAIGNASRHGVLIKGGAYLERAGALRAVAFDKTGTLTRGTPEVQRIVPLNGLAASDLLRLAAAVEARSEHPLAAAIVRAARRAARQNGQLDLPLLPVDQFRAATGSGVAASVDGARILVGKPAWLEREGVALDGAAAALEDLAGAGQTPVVVARAAKEGAEALGVIAIADELRATAAGTVAALRRIGVRRIVMLSGDNTATARAIAAQAGIPPEDVRAELLPEDKVAAIKQLVAEHRAAAMVGDGVNDAPALAAATVGIAMGAGGSDTALETADVALVADDLTRLPWVLQLSRQAAWTIRANVAFALTTKFVVLGLAALGIANLWLAIAADTGASIVVILNGMRLLGRMPLPKAADAARLRRRYGLEEEDEHAGHSH
jgi:Cd2+/Zn2+-exporting ATPase